MDLSVPKVMGILNVTPDSFYAHSRSEEETEIRKRLQSMIEAGADIIDIGGCSTRPGYEAPSPEEEWIRVDKACRILKDISPCLPLSIDTYRTYVAARAIEKWNADIINDISGGQDRGMWTLVSEKKVAYILTHNREDNNTDYADVTADVITYLSKQLNDLHRLGVNDVIIDPGFGFAKTVDQNFQLMSEFQEIVRMGYPVMVGISRKSMIYKMLDVTPEEGLTGTVALHTVALEKGAHILRVHDVKEARETVEIICRLKNSRTYRAQEC